MEGEKDSKTSTTWYVFTMGGKKTSWVLKLQKVVALSTTKVGYVTAANASKELIWLLLEEQVGKPT